MPVPNQANLTTGMFMATKQDVFYWYDSSYCMTLELPRKMPTVLLALQKPQNQYLNALHIHGQRNSSTIQCHVVDVPK